MAPLHALAAALLVVTATAFAPPRTQVGGCRRARRAAAPSRAPPLTLVLGGRGAEADLVPGEDLHAILGVERDATAAQIRAAYRQRARIIHPDVSTAADAPRDFRRLSAAAAILLYQREAWESGGVPEWSLDLESRTEGAGGGWAADSKSWGPVFSAVIGPWLSWYAFVALDSL